MSNNDSSNFAEALAKIRDKLRLDFVSPAATLDDLDTQLYRDLSLYGQDAESFLYWYGQTFKLSGDNFRFADYFPSEGINPVRLIGNLFRGRADYKNYKPLSLRVLAQAAAVGRWEPDDST